MTQDFLTSSLFWLFDLLFFITEDPKKCLFCFRFYFQARNSSRRSRNQVINYIFEISISRQTEGDPTLMLFFISEDFGPKKCHFCFRFRFQTRNSARRSRNQVMDYIFGISISRRTEWAPTSMLFFISKDFSLLFQSKWPKKASEWI